MKLTKLTNAFNKAEAFTKKNSPAILTGLAIVGLISTAYLAYKAGPRAEKILAAKKKDMQDVAPDDKSTKKVVIKETVKEITPVVLPPIIMGVATGACIIGSHSISNRRLAVLSAAYSLSETAVKDLNAKMYDMLGEKKARAVKDAIMQDKLDKTHAQNEQAGNPVIITGNGDVLCMDSYTGREFYSNADKINKAIAELNYNIVSDMYVSLNEFYELIGLKTIPKGDDIGWNIDDTRKGQLPITLTALLTDRNQPCLYIDYDIMVRSDYRNLH